MCKYDFFRDGAEEVGVFCVLHNVLQQLRMDKEVDIFTAVRQIQTRRPEVISKLVNSDLNIKITTTDRMFFFQISNESVDINLKHIIRIIN